MEDKVIADGDVTIAEIEPDVASWKLKSVLFLLPTKTCKVVYTKHDAAGDPIPGRTKTVLFRDVADDPETPSDETDTSFTDLIAFLNAGSNLKARTTTAVKTKLGI